MASPVEIEVKIAVSSAARVRKILRETKFSVVNPRVFEQNLVLDNARGSLKSNGLLLRLRTTGRRSAGRDAGRQPAPSIESGLCTFKGPAKETLTHHKMRVEREFVA